MKVISGIFRFLSSVVLVLIILSLLMVSPVVLGYKPVIILSGSMEPKYPVGGITYYKYATFEDIAVGDAITFSIGDGELATHRVVAVDKAAQLFSTKGDNNETEDASPVDYARVMGKTTPFAIPYAGYFVSYAKQWYVLAVCGVILLADMLLSPGKPKRTTGEAVLLSLTGEETDGNAEEEENVE